MPPEETKRFDEGTPATTVPDTSDTRQLPQVDASETRQLTPIDPSQTRQLAGDNGISVWQSRVPKRLRIVMPDGEDKVFDDLYPHLLVGRKSVANTRHIDVDFEHLDKGVFGISRVHAMILPDDHHGLVIKDLQSVNGTFINNRKLKANELYPLTDGDFIKFGNLKVQIFFNTESET